MSVGLYGKLFFDVMFGVRYRCPRVSSSDNTSPPPNEHCVFQFFKRDPCRSGGRISNSPRSEHMPTSRFVFTEIVDPHHRHGGDEAHHIAHSHTTQRRILPALRYSLGLILQREDRGGSASLWCCGYIHPACMYPRHLMLSGTIGSGGHPHACGGLRQRSCVL